MQGKSNGFSQFFRFFSPSSQSESILRVSRSRRCRKREKPRTNHPITRSKTQNNFHFIHETFTNIHTGKDGSEAVFSCRGDLQPFTSVCGRRATRSVAEKRHTQRRHGCSVPATIRGERAGYFRRFCFCLEVRRAQASLLGKHRRAAV